MYLIQNCVGGERERSKKINPAINSRYDGPRGKFRGERFDVIGSSTRRTVYMVRSFRFTIDTRVDQRTRSDARPGVSFLRARKSLSGSVDGGERVNLFTVIVHIRYVYRANELHTATLRRKINVPTGRSLSFDNKCQLRSRRPRRPSRIYRNEWLQVRVIFSPPGHFQKYRTVKSGMCHAYSRHASGIYIRDAKNGWREKKWKLIVSRFLNVCESGEGKESMTEGRETTNE